MVNEGDFFDPDGKTFTSEDGFKLAFGFVAMNSQASNVSKNSLILPESVGRLRFIAEEWTPDGLVEAEVAFRSCRAEEFKADYGSSQWYDLEYREDIFTDETTAETFFNSLYCVDESLELRSKTVTGDNERNLRVIFESCNSSWFKTGNCLDKDRINDYIKDKGILTLTNN